MLLTCVSRVPVIVAGLCLTGCASLQWGVDAPGIPPAVATRPTTRPAVRTRIAAAVEQATTQPSAGTAQLGPPYKLDIPTIVQLVFERNPDVAAAREDMIAAVHGLEEFRANLSRFEPFVNADSNYSDYPNRSGTKTFLSEATAGIRKETFEGAVFKVEGGGSTSRSKVTDPADGNPYEDSGSGGLLRARIEVPFVGSKKQQDRIINQAYQESNARKARLTYLRDFRVDTVSALSYYNLAVLYQNTGDSFAKHVADLEKLLKDARLAEADRSRVGSVIADYESRESLYRTYHREYVRYLVAAMGLDQNDEVSLVMPEYKDSEFIERSAKPEGLAAMIQEARDNNPTFRVLENAMKDAELQRRLAIEGKFDITAYLEGTHFPVGSTDYDNRFDGWMLGGGVTVSLNDQRVLTASRRKAEASIRSYQAKIEQEMIEIKRQIITETESLRADRTRRQQLLEVIRQKREEYASRSEAYLTAKRVLIDQVLESRGDVTTAEINLNNLLYGCRASDIRLQAALGVYYQIAGLSIADIAGEQKK